MANNWTEARGRVIFLNGPAARRSYLYGGTPPLYEGGFCLPTQLPGTPDAAFIEQNDGSVEAINTPVKQGYPRSGHAQMSALSKQWRMTQHVVNFALGVARDVE